MYIEKRTRYNKNINGAVISNGKVHSEVIRIIKRHLENKNYNIGEEKWKIYLYNIQNVLHVKKQKNG